jgi:hypothetical protein
MNKNHEIGIELKASKFLTKIMEQILVQSTIEKFDKEIIFDMKKEVDDFLKSNKIPPSDKIKLNLSKYLKNKSQISSINYWLKPIGVTEEPIELNQIFVNKIMGLYFSTRRPTGVKIGDIAIAYGVGPTNILSVYEVISEPMFVSKEQIKKHLWKERWPWYVMAKNLTPTYGKIWAKKNLKLHNLEEEFKSTDPFGILTVAGGDTLGALNYGLDKIRLREEFAEYIIGRVNQYNV